MKRQDFNTGWTVGRKANEFAELGGGQAAVEVVLPHDAQISLPRDPAVLNGAPTGFFPSGTWEYTKSFFVPAEDAGRRLWLEFEGVYRSALVYVNGDLAGTWASGYTGFTVPLNDYLRFGEENQIRVEARAHQDSRWYSGIGIIRPVHLLVANPVHIVLDGVAITTPDIREESALVVVDTQIANDGDRTVTTFATTTLFGPDGDVVATDRTPVTTVRGETTTLRQRMLVARPALWNPDSPALYRAEVTLEEGDAELDASDTMFGIREITVDVQHGLRLNGQELKLRGACVHHDNGILGAATINRADERRVELLKEAGFNAIRSAHNPLSRAMLDACDRLGMLVMDEAFDQWTRSKNDFDYTLDFENWWEKDLQAMVVKDRNHPSVFAYSIGNEIQELASVHGARWARRLANATRDLDPTRFVTSGINGALTVMSEYIAQAMEQAKEHPEMFEGMGINTFLSTMADLNNQIGASDLVTQRTAEAFAALDIAGMNYLDARYELDKDLFPHRVIVGAETFPTRIHELWKLVTANSHVIGDFTWTGWDYLGEVGLGRAQYADDLDGGGVMGTYPWLVAHSGDIDITGRRRPASFYREIVFGLRDTPYIAVQRPDSFGRENQSSPWAWTDSLSSWNWSGSEERPVTVEVYSSADEVELLLDDTSLGKKPTGVANAYRAHFDTTYRPGILNAVAYTNGVEMGRESLRTAAGTRTLRASVDRSEVVVGTGDLAYIDLALVDANGTVFTEVSSTLTVRIDGPGHLQGLGNANPRDEESFVASSHSTHDGRALAIVRPTAPGVIIVTVSSDDGMLTSVTLNAVAHRSAL